MAPFFSCHGRIINQSVLTYQRRHLPRLNVTINRLEQVRSLALVANGRDMIGQSLPNETTTTSCLMCRTSVPLTTERHQASETMNN
jgi:hypothetical protein